jgi:hypothetical protein
VSLAHADPSTFEVSLYKDTGRTQLVASGTQAISGGTISGTIALGEENASGLTGQFEIATPADNATIELGAVPLVTAWQLQTLRFEWQSEDHPSDAYSDGTTVVPLSALPLGIVFPPALQSRIQYDKIAKVIVFTGVMAPADYATLTALSTVGEYLTAIQGLYVQSQRPSVIDPDVIGPDDFRAPVPKVNAAFDVWLGRRSWVDAQLKGLATITTVLNGVTVPDLKTMLGSMYTGVTYGTATIAPWNSSTTPVSALENLWEDLSEGVSVAAIRQQIAADLGLTIDAFNRLIELKHHDQAAWFDSRNPPVSADGWREVYSILVEGMKTRFSAVWRAEEAALPLVFGSQTFVVSLREPPVGNWPPVIPVGQPLVDPALVALTDLPEPTIGAGAITFWQARMAQEAQITQALRQARETTGLQSALTQAVGDPKPGDPLPVDLDLLAQQLLDPDPKVVAAATATIPSELFILPTPIPCYSRPPPTGFRFTKS